jgi:epoxide hydrolase
MATDADMIEPFRLAISDAVLEDLRRRLDATRWPESETVEDWSQGAPLAQVQALCEYWRRGYDWRRCETMLNGLGQHRTVIDGLGIHFLHVRSPRSDALPLLLTHGWPGSILEFRRVIGPLSDPVTHGGEVSDAFHLVIPSLPGYGFSDKPTKSGWGVSRIARAWTTLMKRLGYDRFVAQGGDWGAAVTTEIGRLRPPECVGIHLNMPIAFPSPEDTKEMTVAEADAAAAMALFRDRETGYSKQQSTKPQTLGYGLVDSPAGQAAWVFEKFRTWSDCGGDVKTVFTYDELLDNIMLYWLPGTGASSARLYWESMASGFRGPQSTLATGCSIFAKEIFRPSRRWAERCYPNIVYWNEIERGGHFAALEQPDLFVREMRACFRLMR